MEKGFIVLVSAHLIADFFLQPDWLHGRKKEWWAGVVHSFIAASLTYLFLQKWQTWFVAILIFFCHFVIDAIKQRFKDTWRTFCLDQIAHIVALALIARLCPRWEGVGLKWMVLVAGFSLSVQGSGFLVGKITTQLQQKNNLEDQIKGLKNGGKLIGQLERALIFLFIVIDQPMGIGFLVAAKSILRFGEAKEDQKLAEYVLIGTLLSFSLAVAAASLTQTVLKCIPIWK